MGFRTLIIKNKAKLEYSLNYLKVRYEDDDRQINLDEINSVIIQSTQVSMTAALLANLAEKNINVVICDNKANPSAELINYNGIYDSREKIVKQFNFKDEIVSKCWSLIIKEKIKNQLRIINKYGGDEKTSYLLSRYIDEVELNDITNREGHAAKIYFNTLFGLNFTRNDLCDTNMFLDYGYTIILSCFNRSIRSLGYYPELGIHHIGKENPFNLSCDLMEPLRPLVDSYIVSKKVDSDNFKLKFVDLLNLKVDYDGDIMYLENAIRLYCKMILSSLSNDNVQNIKFINYDI